MIGDWMEPMADNKVQGAIASSFAHMDLNEQARQAQEIARQAEINTRLRSELGAIKVALDATAWTTAGDIYTCKTIDVSRDSVRGIEEALGLV